MASAEELEENTTYTNADGTECIIPAVHSAGYLHQTQSAAVANASSGNSSSSVGGFAGASQDPDWTEASAFIERYVVALYAVVSNVLVLFYFSLFYPPF